mgnify:FL=1
MKKIFIIFSIFLLSVPVWVRAEEKLATNARNAILVEVNTGTVLFEKNMNDRVAVASLTKMMSQLLILESIEKGTLKWDEVIKVSSNASGYGGTQIYLQPGEEMTVRDLMKGISMASANDATVALAERIAGSEDNFVKMMMDKVRELGLKNTNFVNPTGLDQDNHYSSAYDLSIIARELMKHEQIFEFSSLYEDYLRVDTPNKFWLVNTNKLVRFYEGADGLKTGFTDAAKYCMAVTSKRNGMRILAIVLGEDVSKVRNQETTALLDYGFNLYEVSVLRKKDEVVDKVKVERSNSGKVEIVTKEEISILKKKNDAAKEYTQKVELDKISLPLKKNDVVGKLKVFDGNNLIGEYDLIVNKNVSKKNFLQILGDNLRDIVVGRLSF